jgi:hypothetical protein
VKNSYLQSGFLLPLCSCVGSVFCLVEKLWRQEMMVGHIVWLKVAAIYQLWMQTTVADSKHVCSVVAFESGVALWFCQVSTAHGGDGYLRMSKSL